MTPDRLAGPPHRRFCRPLRRRMVLTVVALATTGLFGTDLAGAAVLRSYLVGRLDAQLEGQARSLARDARLREQATTSPIALADFLVSQSGATTGTRGRIFVYATDGTRVYTSPTGGDGEPALGDAAGLEVRADAPPFTVTGKAGDWRVLVTPITDGKQYLVHAIPMADVTAAERAFVLIGAAVTATVLMAIALATASVVRVGLRPVQVALADRGASERRLRQFLADASHELRTPLTSIQGFAELYRRGGAPPGPALDEAMGRIESEVSRMRLLVNDLLLLARLDEERPLDRHPVDLLAVAADAVRDAHVRVPSRFVQLAALHDENAMFEAVTVYGDEPRIRQVVTNLLVNALQHTPDDAAIAVRVGRSNNSGAGAAPTVSIPIAAVGADPPAGQPVATIEVADAGPGMTPAEARHAFERLYRADPNRAGTGLGLAIVAAIVQAHGGRVELYTAPGAGARFRVLMPAGRD